jgi:RHS repeat-associated protein
VAYSYDNVGGSPTKGLLLSVSVGTQSSESYSYNADRMVSSVTRPIGSRNYVTSYQYTTAGQVTQLTYPSTRQLNINHDSIGRLSSIVNAGDSTNYLSGVSYNVAGQTTGWTLGGSYGGGIVESFGYSSTRLQLTSQTATQNGFTRLSLTYNYQASAGQMGAGSTAGNAGQLMSVSGQIGGTTESASYTYDLLGRLVTSNQTSNGASAQRRFVYDRWGNRTEVWDATSGGTQIQSVTLEQSGGAPTNRLTSVTNSGNTVNYAYDSAGNVTSDGVHSYGYDAENRLVSVDGGSTASYSYDHQNRRVKKVVGSSTTHYVWEGYQVIAEHNGSTGAVVTEYVYAGGRMIAREQAGRVFFLQDQLSIRATVTDGQGGIQGRQGHLPFGDELGTSGTQEKHRFSSYERDPEIGADYAVNRYYGHIMGRFTTSDPYAGGYRSGTPQSQNRYAYAANDAINRTDPLGLFFGPVYYPDPDCVLRFDLVRGFLWDCPLPVIPLDRERGGPRALGKCSIRVHTAGRQKSTFDASSVTTGPNLGRDLGPGESGSAEGYWYYFFEVEVIIPRDTRGESKWTFWQSAILSVRLEISVDGKPIPISYTETDPDDTPDGAYTQWLGGNYYWTDTPGRQKIHRHNTEKRPVVNADVTWHLIFDALNRADIRRSCSKELYLTLSVRNGAVSRWSVFVRDLSN